MMTSVRTLPSLKARMSKVTFRWSLIAFTTRNSLASRTADPGLQRAVGGGMGQFGGGVDGELRDGAVGVLEGQVDIDVVAVGQDIRRLDGGARRRVVNDLQHQVDGGAGGQRRLRDCQQGMADGAVLVGRLDVQLDRHFAPVDDGDQMFAMGQIARLEDMAEGDLARSLGLACDVLELEGDKFAGLGRIRQIGGLEDRTGSLYLDHGRDDGQQGR